MSKTTNKTLKVLFDSAKRYAAMDGGLTISRQALVQDLADAKLKAGFQVQQVPEGGGRKEYGPETKAIREGLVAGWLVSGVYSQVEYDLWLTDAKDLTSDEKDISYRIDRALSSRMNKLSGELDKLLHPEKYKKTGSVRGPDHEFLIDWITKGAKRVATSDGAQGMDLILIGELIGELGLLIYPAK